MKHCGKISALLLCAGWLSAVPQSLADGAGPSESKTRNVNVAQFEKLRAETNVVVLDVRTPEEFAKGHIPGATNIDFLATGFRNRIEPLDKSKTYLVNCAAGVRSAKACLQLENLRFPSVVNLQGGYAAWVKESKQAPEK